MLAALTLLAAAPATAGDVLYGFTAFPHALTAESADQVHARIRPRATLYAKHHDGCVPWHAALAGAPFPHWVEDGFREVVRRRAKDQATYVAVTPTGMDRRRLAPACGASEDAPRPLPPVLRGQPLDAPAVRRAYTAYVRRVVEITRPQFVVIGIEMSELALLHPAEWPAFERLFRATVDALRQSHPQVRVGLELVLQSLLLPRVAAQVKPAAEHGDFVGISFYPYGSAYGAMLGAPPLPDPPEQWRAPLRFLRGWTDKPVAIAETGYASATERLDSLGGLAFPGDLLLQRAFLADLIDEAVHEGWLFVVWFVPVDYTKLLAALDGLGTGAEWMRIWVRTGLWDAELRPKPALRIWKRWRDQAAIRAAPRRF